jgi:hypothetical protein
MEPIRFAFSENDRFSGISVNKLYTSSCVTDGSDTGDDEVQSLILPLLHFIFRSFLFLFFFVTKRLSAEMWNNRIADGRRSRKLYTGEEGEGVSSSAEMKTSAVIAFVSYTTPPGYDEQGWFVHRIPGC